MAAGSIVIDLLMKTGSFETDTKRAERALKNLEKEALNAGKVIGAAFAATTAAVAYFVKGQVDAADEVGKMAQKAGVTTEAFSALAYGADLSGVSNESLTSSLVRLSKTMADAAGGGKEAQAALAALGISATDASGKLKSSDEVFKEVARRFAAMPDGVEKTAAAVAIFGRSGADLIPLLNAGASGLRGFADEAQRLGRIIDGDTAKASENFNDNITRLKAGASGLALAIGKEVLPELNRLIEQFLTGTRVAGGFTNALLTFATINPFRSEAGNIKALREELADLSAARERYLKSGSDTSGIDQAITTTSQKLAYLVELQKQSANLARGYDPEAFSAAAGGGRGFVSPPLASPAMPRTKASGGGMDKELRERERLLELDRRGWVELAEYRVNADFEASQELARQQINDLEFRDGLRRQEIDGWVKLADEKVDADFRAAQELARQQIDALKQIEDVGKELGLTFSSAFEDAIVGGKKLSDVVKGLEQDLVRLITRKAVTEPLADFASGLFKGGGDIFSNIAGAIFGGGKAGGGDVIAGRQYLVGERGPELLTMGGNGTITPMGGGAGMTLNQYFTVPPATDRRSQAQIAAAAGVGVNRAMARNS